MKGKKKWSPSGETDFGFEEVVKNSPKETWNIYIEEVDIVLDQKKDVK